MMTVIEIMEGKLSEEGSSIIKFSQGVKSLATVCAEVTLALAGSSVS